MQKEIDQIDQEADLKREAIQKKLDRATRAADQETLDKTNYYYNIFTPLALLLEIV